MYLMTCYILLKYILNSYRCSNDIAIGAVGVRFDSLTVKSDTMSPTARHRKDDTSELCRPSAKLQKCASPLL